MNCLLCGEVCRCPEPLPSALSQLRPAESSVVSDSSAEIVPQAPGAPAWRDELSARLSRYRARRKVRPPRYPSLSLRFEAQELPASPTAVTGFSPLEAFEPVSNHALALDEMRREPSAAETEIESQQAPVAEAAPRPPRTPIGHSAAHPTAKIIEFPGAAWGRSAWGPPPPSPDQLAEPVSERPRILEVPEVEPPLPALGGITIEAAEHPEAEKRPGIDFPLESAALGVRLVAALVDALIVAAASAIFGVIFWKVAAVRPPLAQILGLAVGISCLFWAAYQYLLIVYAATTPGLRAAGLALARFDGSPTGQSLRCWRVLAACLSGLSLGMGYAWVFLDEDALCWHDRITHTYLAPRGRAASSKPR
jgi:uncharacterized RDD family membrane protein YckC